MHRAWLVPVFVGLAAASVAAQSLQGDPAGDGEPDLRSLAWSESDGTLQLQATVGQPWADGQGLRLFWARGQAGAAEPQEWYVLVVDRDVAALAGHDSSATVVATMNRSQEVLQVELGRVGASQDACTVLAAESGRFDGPGFVRGDIFPDGLVALEQAWPGEGADCPAAAPIVSESPSPEPKGAPGLPLALLLGVLGVASGLRRR